MIRNPLGLRLSPEHPIREQIHEAATLGAKGVVIDAFGDLAPQRLGETGRRELRHLLRSVEMSLIAIALPTRRSFDTADQLDERMRRAESVFSMAYELGTKLVLLTAGSIPPLEDPRRSVFTFALRELGLRADHRGVRLALETAPESTDLLIPFLEELALPSLAVSINPTALLQAGIDPVPIIGGLAPWIAHAYASDASGRAIPAANNPRGFGYPPGVLDWEEYLGALEEVAYTAFLTVWPSPNRPAGAQFTAINDRLLEF
jgi:sugar phosphate isomerase/epimerase